MKRVDAILTTNLRQHPAVQAWSHLVAAPVEPDYIEVLKHKSRSSVYRLAGIGPGNAGVIAKRAHLQKAVVERDVYEQVLSRLPSSSPDYYGFVEEEGASFAWLFLEDVGGEQYSPGAEEHRRLVGRWLGALQAFSERSSSRNAFAERGPDFYRGHLQSIRETLPRLQARSSISPEGVEVLDHISLLCEYLESCWMDLEGFCEHVPRTLVHTDCLPKNVHVREAGDGVEVAVFDWGGAGWGLAATDLGQLALPFGGPPVREPDYLAYWEVTREHWPALRLESIRQLAYLGQLFWALKVIDLSFPVFDYPSQDVVEKYRLYSAALARSIDGASWGPAPGAAAPPPVFRRSQS